VTADEAGHDVLEACDGIHAVQLAALDHRREDGPVLCAIVGPGEERILAVKRQRSFILPTSATSVRFSTAGVLTSAVGY